MKTYKISYDAMKFNFRKLVEEHFGTPLLEELHEGHNIPFFADKSADQSTALHKKFYEIYNDEAFLSLYQSFVKEVIHPTLGDLVYQTKPTFRIHLPNNVAVGEWHKDGDYHHQRSEINYWLPFTRAFGNNTIWIESEEDKGDYQPYEVENGEVLVFKGSYLRHGNKPNDTGVSRLSIDFRIVPLAEFQEVNEGSSHLKIKFKIGEYYSLLKHEN